MNTVQLQEDEVKDEGPSFREVVFCLELNLDTGKVM